MARSKLDSPDCQRSSSHLLYELAKHKIAKYLDLIEATTNASDEILVISSKIRTILKDAAPQSSVQLHTVLFGVAYACNGASDEETISELEDSTLDQQRIPSLDQTSLDNPDTSLPLVNGFPQSGYPMATMPIESFWALLSANSQLSVLPF